MKLRANQPDTHIKLVASFLLRPVLTGLESSYLQAEGGAMLLAESAEIQVSGNIIAKEVPSFVKEAPLTVFDGEGSGRRQMAVTTVQVDLVTMGTERIRFAVWIEPLSPEASGKPWSIEVIPPTKKVFQFLRSHTQSGEVVLTFLYAGGVLELHLVKRS